MLAKTSFDETLDLTAVFLSSIKINLPVVWTLVEQYILMRRVLCGVRQAGGQSRGEATVSYQKAHLYLFFCLFVSPLDFLATSHDPRCPLSNDPYKRLSYFDFGGKDAVDHDVAIALGVCDNVMLTSSTHRSVRTVQRLRKTVYY